MPYTILILNNSILTIYDQGLISTACNSIGPAINRISLGFCIFIVVIQ